MSSRIRRIVGLFLLLPTWYYAINPIIPDREIISSILVRGLLTVLSLGLSYSLLHKKNYPVQVILTVLIAEFIVYRLKIRDYYNTTGLIYFFNLFLGTLLVLTGEYRAKFFCFILSPIQNFLRSIGIRVTIPVIAGTLVIPIGLIGIEFLSWWEDYRLYHRYLNR